MNESEGSKLAPMCLRSLRRAGVKPPAEAQAVELAGHVMESRAARKKEIENRTIDLVSENVEEMAMLLHKIFKTHCASVQSSSFS